MSKALQVKVEDITPSSHVHFETLSSACEQPSESGRCPKRSLAIIGRIDCQPAVRMRCLSGLAGGGSRGPNGVWRKVQRGDCLISQLDIVEHCRLQADTQSQRAQCK